MDTGGGSIPPRVLEPSAGGDGGGHGGGCAAADDAYNWGPDHGDGGRDVGEDGAALPPWPAGPSPFAAQAAPAAARAPRRPVRRMHQEGATGTATRTATAAMMKPPCCGWPDSRSTGRGPGGRERREKRGALPPRPGLPVAAAHWGWWGCPNRRCGSAKKGWAASFRGRAGTAAGNPLAAASAAPGPGSEAELLSLLLQVTPAAAWRAGCARPRGGHSGSPGPLQAVRSWQ